MIDLERHGCRGGFSVGELDVFIPGWRDRVSEIGRLKARITELEAHLNTPELYDFAKGVVAEAQHARARWAASHDAGKTEPDWFWLLGYLAGKILHALKSGDREKALHHCISSAAALANWHAAISGASNAMRPGIDPPAGVA